MTIFSLLLGSCVSATSQIRLATYQYSTNTRVENLQPLAKVLSGRLQQPVEVISYQDVNELVHAMRSGKVDLAFISTMGYLHFDQSGSAKTMVPIMAWQVDQKALDQYKCVFITSTDNQCMWEESIKRHGKYLNFLLVSKSSASGNLIPRLMLKNMGITDVEKHFKTVAYGGTHEATAQMVAEGKADVGAIGSTTYFEFIKQNPQSLRALHMSGEIPLGPILVNKRLSSTDRSIIIHVLKNLHTTDPEAFAAVKNGWSEAASAVSFKEADGKQYTTLQTP